MMEFLRPWVGWGFRADLVTVQETERYLGVNLVCSNIGLVVCVNIQQKIGKFVKYPRRYQVVIDQGDKL